MIEQLMFVACLTLYMYLTLGNIWRPSIVCTSNCGKRDNDSVNACTGCYCYNALFLRTRE